MKIPRKLKKKIPKDTPYCYTIDWDKIKRQNPTDGVFIIPCPFHSFTIEKGEVCMLTKIQLDNYCKSCGRR